MALYATINCKWCIFRHAKRRLSLISQRAAHPTRDRGAPREPAVVSEAASSRPALSPAPTVVLACLALTMLLPSLGTSIANVALPTLVQAFSASFQAVQWVVLAYLLAVTTVIVSVGRLADLFGRRRLMLIGIGLFTLASLACGLSTELWMLIGARAAQGLGAAIMMALTMAMVGDLVPAARSGSAMGFLGTTSAIGTALGPSLGGVLISAWSWEAIFLINLPLGLLAWLLVRRLPVDVRSQARPDFDLVGSLLLAATLAAYALAMTLGKGRPGLLNAALLATALVFGATFLVAQTKTPAPLVRPQLLRQPGIRAGFIMSSLASAVAMTTLVVGPFYLTGALHLAPANVGLVMTAGPLVAALVGVPAGRGVDRFGRQHMLLVGLAGMAIGVIGLALAAPDAGVPAYLMPLMVTTAGFAVFQAANNTSVVTGVEPAQRGVVSGLLNLSRNLGLITGASVMAAIYAFASDARHDAASSVEAVATGAHVAFASAAALVAIALLLSLRQHRARQ
ncbi:MAG TPA: MFS transporter [Luteimonas sp.]|nr:MFS transporter [Luteimonas sp.]